MFDVPAAHVSAWLHDLNARTAIAVECSKCGSDSLRRVGSLVRGDIRWHRTGVAEDAAAAQKRGGAAYVHKVRAGKRKRHYRPVWRKSNTFS
jgi:hypothetical protein